MDRQVTNEEFNKAYSSKDNLLIIHKVCSQYRNILSVDELKSCGQIALWRCLRHHDYTKNKFTTSLYRFTQWECNREVRKILQRKKTQEIEEGIEDLRLGGEGPTLEMSELLDQLSDIQRQVIYQRFFKGMTLREIGESLNFTKEAARQHIKRAVERLNKLCTLSYHASVEI